MNKFSVLWACHAEVQPEQTSYRSSHQQMFFKIVFFKIQLYSQENACVGVSYSCNFQVFFFEYCEIFKNRFFIEYLQWLLLFWSQQTDISLQPSSHRSELPWCTKVSLLLLNKLIASICKWKLLSGNLFVYNLKPETMYRQFSLRFSLNSQSLKTF